MENKNGIPIKIGDTVKWSLKGKGVQYYTGIVNEVDGELYFGDYFANECLSDVEKIIKENE